MDLISNKNRIIIFTNYYLPGFKCGGPIQSVKAITSKLKSDFDFYVFTSDRDLGDSEPYRNLRFNLWTNVDNTSVYYFSGSLRKYILVVRQLCKGNVIYLNSFFNFRFSIIIVLIRKFFLLKGLCILCPRGEFNPGAFFEGKSKKMFYIALAKTFGLYRGVKWHATTLEEMVSIKSFFGEDVNVALAEGISPRSLYFSKEGLLKNVNELRLIFLARISPIKNLLFFLEVLGEIHLAENQKIVFDIYGPIEDINYWKKCLDLISAMKNRSDLSIQYRSEVVSKDVQETIANYHIYVLPSLGENYGQSIVDSFTSGCPVLISQNTPWKNLQARNVGWDVPLTIDSFIDVLGKALLATQSEYDLMRRACYNFGDYILNNEEILNRYRRLFNDSI